MAIGWVTIVLAVVVLQLIAFAQYPFMGALAAANTATSSAVFGIVIADLVTVFRTILILALLMVVAGFLTGPSRPAAYLQRQIGRLVNPAGANAFLRWVSANATYVVGGIAAVAVLLIVFPFSRTAVYMISIAAIAILLSLFVLSMQKAVPPSRSKNNR